MYVKYRYKKYYFVFVFLIGFLFHVGACCSQQAVALKKEPSSEPLAYYAQNPITFTSCLRIKSSEDIPLVLADISSFVLHNQQDLDALKTGQNVNRDIIRERLLNASSNVSLLFKFHRKIAIQDLKYLNDLVWNSEKFDIFKTATPEQMDDLRYYVTVLVETINAILGKRS